MERSRPPSKPGARVFLRGSSAAQVASVCPNSPAVPPRLQSDSAPFNYKLHKSYFLSGASPANVNTISRKFCSQENLFVSGQLEWLWYEARVTGTHAFMILRLSQEHLKRKCVNYYSLGVCVWACIFVFHSDFSRTDIF